jgi:hypothetical protein
MATFRPVNTAPLAPDPQGHNPEETNPLTPRSNAAPNNQLQNMSRDDATTPTRANFGALASQRPLPSTSPFPSAITVPSNDEPKKTQLNRGNSQHSTKSRESEDVDMDEDGDEEGEEGSEDESVNDDGTRSKKKKSQRFYCTDYPPCSLSFTRSEHLARHIRYVTPLLSEDLPGLTLLGNTLVNVPFNATAPADSRDSITFDSMPRLCTKTKRYHRIR